jgi:hypothetical protein
MNVGEGGMGGAGATSLGNCMAIVASLACPARVPKAPGCGKVKCAWADGKPVLSPGSRTTYTGCCVVGRWAFMAAGGGAGGVGAALAKVRVTGTVCVVANSFADSGGFPPRSTATHPPSVASNTHLTAADLIRESSPTEPHPAPAQSTLSW